MKSTMRRYQFATIFVLAVAYSCGLCDAAEAPAGQPLRVLFLGDRGPHRPADRARQLIPVMNERGIEITYTEDMGKLNPGTLGDYDGLLLYANIERIAADQEEAVLDYVEKGGAFIPIHCASYCFHNSPKLIALTGGQFKEHGTGVFRTTIAEQNHPVVVGFEPFESWDETYVHHRHNEKDRTVLSYRHGGRQAAGNEREPWTWVRTHGEGRVFYTAWGHDHRTWGNPGFHDLVERGIRWATRTLDSENAFFRPPRNPKQMIAARGPKPFEHKEEKIPFYPAGKKRGTTESRSRMQLPLPAAESMKHLVTPEGFEVKLFAAEPDIGAALAMAWDERGRLWLCESVDYPNERKPEGEGRDRIRICEDTDGDGKADKFTIFADNLSIPTSIAFANGGVVVHQAPDTLLLRDTDGDDRADTREVLLTGWGTNDTHAGPNSLQYGLDNHFWGVVGYSGFRGEVGGERHRFGNGIYRFKPDGSGMEFVRNNSNNCWGLGISEDGHVFGSTANGNPSVYVSIPNRYYERVTGWSSGVLPPIADTHRFAPISDNIRQVDHHGGYTAAAGHALYTARTYPRPYWNRTAFVTGCTGKLVGTFVLRRDGAGFRASSPFNLLASDDEWTAPIVAEVGPDGNVWVLDWYNYIVQHNPTPAGYETGSGNAYVSPLRDKQHCRIYRVVYKGAKSADAMSLRGATPKQLVAALRHPNMLWRRHAQRLLVERGKDDVTADLIDLVGDRSVDAIGLNVGAIHALWTLHGLGQLGGGNPTATAAAVRALRHPSTGVRRNAALVLPRTKVGLGALMKGKLLADGDPQVRFATLLALAEMPAQEDVGKALLEVLSSPGNHGDPLIRDAATAAAAQHDSGFIAAVLSKAKRSGDSVANAPEPINLIADGSFEKVVGDAPKHWRRVTYSGRADLSTTESGRSGKRCAQITSESGADASWTFTAAVQPRTRYQLSAWIRTKDLDASTGRGALLNIHQLRKPRVLTAPVTGTTDWKRVSVDFDSRDLDRIDVNCLFGGWGQSRGQAWYDDVSLTRLGPAIDQIDEIPNGVADVFKIVTAHYAARVPRESIVQTLLSLRETSPAVAAYVLDGLANGWPDDATVDFTPEQEMALVQLMNDLDPLQQDRLLQLARRWDRHEVFSKSVQPIVESMRQRVTNEKLTDAQRIDAAKRLIQLRDDPATAQWLLDQINAQASPSFTAGMVAAVATSRRADAAEDIIGQWRRFSPVVRTAAVNAMLQRKSWTVALLQAIKDGALHRSELSAEHVLRLTNHPDQNIKEISKTITGAGVQNEGRMKVYEAFKPSLELKGDLAQGRELFTNRCAVCHSIDDLTKGKVGPNLTGIGARAKNEILLEIIDPNRSLVGTYRLWDLETTDYDMITGKLVSEDKTSVTMMDLVGQTHVIQRKDIESLGVQNLSIMPNGLIDDLKPAEAASLLAFLSASKAKH